jgi:adenosylcobinamide kinase/adenosylcobinamide-phosphate guanylyltransferase
MGRRVLVTGGARSGKSAHALALGARAAGPRAFVATLEPLDDEMRARAEAHRMERGAGWETVLEPLDLAGRIGGLAGTHAVVVVDCLTLWLSNVMLAGRDPEAETGRLVRAVEAMGGGGADLLMVTNEVGMGIVPENELARRFRDNAGALNRRLAAVADEVILMVAGLPVSVKRT